MLVIIRAIAVGPGFHALLELDEEGQLLRVRSPDGEEAEQHWRDRVARFHEMLAKHVPEGESLPHHVVRWLSRDNMYNSFQVVGQGDFEEVYRMASAEFVAGKGMGQPVRVPEDVKAALAEPERHWKKGHSRYELATSWLATKDIPPTVRAVLDVVPMYKDARLTKVHFEKRVDLRTAGRDSQTDAMVYLTLRDGFGAVLAVEGKVDESFARVVGDWKDGGEGKTTRLGGLCDSLGLDPDQVDALRYQLLPRTCSALYEAETQHVKQAVMLVHSFSPAQTGFRDFQAFAQMLGLRVAEVNTLSEEKLFGSVRLRLGWVADQKSK